MPRHLPVVALLLPRARTARRTNDGVLLRPGESPLSRNAVAGATVEVPIEATCSPSKVCVGDCYAASGPQAIPHNIAKQFRTLRSMEADPQGFAERIAAEADRIGAGHIRWNGVGDLTPAAIIAIHALARLRPDLPVWVVTRIPELAARVGSFPNVFVHFSLDRAEPRTANYFFSYQCAADEVPPSGAELGVSVIFSPALQACGGLRPHRPGAVPAERRGELRRGVCGVPPVLQRRGPPDARRGPRRHRIAAQSASFRAASRSSLMRLRTWPMSLKAATGEMLRMSMPRRRSSCELLRREAATSSVTV